MNSFSRRPSAVVHPQGSEHTALHEAAGCSPHTLNACRPVSFLLQALGLSYLLAWGPGCSLEAIKASAQMGTGQNSPCAPRPTRACPQAPLRGRACPSSAGPAGILSRAALGVHPAHCLVLWHAHFRLMSQSSAVSYDSSAEPSGFGVEMKEKKVVSTLPRDDAFFSRLGEQGVASWHPALSPPLYPLKELL